MKNFKIKSLLFSLFTVLMITVTMTSCEKTETVEAPIDAIEENNITTNSGEIEIDKTNAKKPILHKSFSKDLTKEEANAEWNKVVDEYIQSLPEEEIDDRGYGKSWYLTAVTHTGSGSSDDTDDDVYAGLSFRSDRGNFSSPWWELNNHGDDREEGDWDYYLMRYDHHSYLRYVGLNSATIALCGDDGWYLKYFDITIRLIGKNYSCSIVQDDRNVWLDNSNSNLCAYHYSGGIGSGTCYF